jgi:hypothetical protein
VDGEIVVERRRQWTPEAKAALMAEVAISITPTRSAKARPDLLAGMNRELGHGSQILAAGYDGRCKGQSVGAGHRGMPTVLELPHPRYDGAVLTAHHQLHSQLDPAALAPDETDEVGASIAAAHAVDQGNGAIRCFEPGFQDQRALAISAGNLGIALWRDLPTAILRVA